MHPLDGISGPTISISYPTDRDLLGVKLGLIPAPHRDYMRNDPMRPGAFRVLLYALNDLSPREFLEVFRWYILTGRIESAACILDEVSDHHLSALDRLDLVPILGSAEELDRMAGIRAMGRLAA
jgi:hypothetical protein